MAHHTGMSTQILRPKGMGLANTISLAALGLDYPNGISTSGGRNWFRDQTSRHESFCLHASESYSADDALGYTQQQDYVKANFWLSGRHTTVLDGFGQHEHDRPEIVLTSGPYEMLKMDAIRGGTQVESVSVCFLPQFFPLHMGLETSALPAPLRAMLSGAGRPYAFHRIPLTTNLSVAARAILAAPFAVRQDPVYGKAKAIELMCLLINQLSPAAPGSASLQFRNQSRLLEARDILTRRLAQPVSLEELAQAVGLNRLALTSGFHQLFGSSVYDYFHKYRMERAHALLQDEDRSITQIAQAVGYSHACNFSTAFKAHFGYIPRLARGTYL
jgi:AraC-like DNA-binding protein